MDKELKVLREYWDRSSYPKFDPFTEGQRLLMIKTPEFIKKFEEENKPSFSIRALGPIEDCNQNSDYDFFLTPYRGYGVRWPIISTPAKLFPRRR